jgi:hypothetical protein
MNLLPTGRDAGVFTLNDPMAELGGIALYILLPMVAVGLLSRLAMYLQSRRVGPEPDVLSPTPKSAMLGVLSYAVSTVLFMLSHGDFSSIKPLVYGPLFGIILSAPTLFIMGPIYIAYVLQRRRNGTLPSYVVYAACFASIVIQYLYFLQFSGS